VLQRKHLEVTHWREEVNVVVPPEPLAALGAQSIAKSGVHRKNDFNGTTLHHVQKLAESARVVRITCAVQGSQRKTLARQPQSSKMLTMGPFPVKHSRIEHDISNEHTTICEPFMFEILHSCMRGSQQFL
jgi:hypothetical protein